ncbi:MAG: hypothetical protein C0469_08895 [Cyanobacteria bacterium DS2.3.42]|nr:hypothetical protein [Cyanobacteria bacterium DS2.3.42]
MSSVKTQNMKILHAIGLMLAAVAGVCVTLFISGSLLTAGHPIGAVIAFFGLMYGLRRVFRRHLNP